MNQNRNGFSEMKLGQFFKLHRTATTNYVTITLMYYSGAGRPAAKQM